MYGAALPKDLNLPIQLQQPAAGVRTPPQQPMSAPGLLRYRSAPSTLLGDDFLPAAAAGTGPDDAVFARFLAGGHRPDIRDDNKPPRPVNSHFPEVAATAASMAASQQQLMYQSQQQMAAMEGTALYRTASTGGGTDHAASGGGNSLLLRQSSSPADFLNHLNMDNGGYGNMLRAGMSGGGGGFRNGEAPRLKGQLSFSSSRQGSMMSQISEMVGEELGGGGGNSSADDEAGSNGGYGIPGPGGYPMGGAASSAGWDDPSPSPLLSVDSLQSSGPAAAAKRRRDSPGNNGASVPPIKHQLSLPPSGKTSPEMAAIEKFLQFQDAVPCKIRAKRGCATHPRSIAERLAIL
ncbi:transcription factor bHLH130 isoform X2 [Brachypodium distachyon]|uniref:Transcription factor bHLH130 n=1 Tax=Brachypodium distachyon TaxID=15368 RepID=A0A2K2CS27_BRADI|nr:transcription factor bHLH130 isoform X2 [Brachypodium distachyon]PNT64830.1 hypothetical protein BRADI_4g33670v3 [Brachypodium distachyon]|eukprot:XP_024310994.1 transcription factor bHLH130 isoform X2 [Brachypodium distachyon]